MDLHSLAGSLLEFYRLHPNDLDIFLNAVLVETGVRNAFLIQPVDYKEPIGGPGYQWQQEAPKTQEFLNTIHRMFPNMKFIHMDQGVLVLRRETPIRFDPNNYTQAQLGQLLSYPCPGDIEGGRNFVAHYKVNYLNKDYHLLASICGSDKNPQIKIMTDQIQQVIDGLNLSLRNGLRFEYYIDPIFSTETLIDAVINQQVTPAMENEIANLLANSDLILLNILEENKVMSIFELKFRPLLLDTLLRIQAEELYPNPLLEISDWKERDAVHKILVQKRQDGIANILQQIYGVQVDPRYRQHALNYYFE